MTHHLTYKTLTRHTHRRNKSIAQLFTCYTLGFIQCIHTMCCFLLLLLLHPDWLTCTTHFYDNNNTCYHVRFYIFFFGSITKCTLTHSKVSKIIKRQSNTFSSCINVTQSFVSGPRSSHTYNSQTDSAAGILFPHSSFSKYKL